MIAERPTTCGHSLRSVKCCESVSEPPPPWRVHDNSSVPLPQRTGRRYNSKWTDTTAAPGNGQFRTRRIGANHSYSGYGWGTDNLKGGGVKKTTASDLTLITGVGRVPLTRSQVASWRQHLATTQRRERSLAR